MRPTAGETAPQNRLGGKVRNQPLPHWVTSSVVTGGEVVGAVAGGVVAGGVVAGGVVAGGVVAGGVVAGGDVAGVLELDEGFGLMVLGSKQVRRRWSCLRHR